MKVLQCGFVIPPSFFGEHSNQDLTFGFC